MVQIRRGFQDKAANGRRRHATAPQAIAERACLPPDTYVVVVMSMYKHERFLLIVSARSPPHGQLERSRLRLTF